jgi:hypothetical protein
MYVLCDRWILDNGPGLLCSHCSIPARLVNSVLIPSPPSHREKLGQKEAELNQLRGSMELKDSAELRELEAAWRSLADLTASWKRELHHTEQLATRLEDKLVDVETRLKQLELNSVEWDLPPSLGGRFFLLCL